ncbi:hypothetical protein J4G37_52080, partial [Microvirga sp. 3-52]|nr:hypothetical protein [Microvirga sp. 3-52]
MNNIMENFIHENIDSILEKWACRMKDVEEERFFHFMPDELIDKTSKEFAELMTSNLQNTGSINSEKLVDFTEKVVRFGWSIKFVNKSIENFSDATFEMMEEHGVIDESNARDYMRTFSKW